jgi:hypothetical protein
MWQQTLVCSSLTLILRGRPPITLKNLREHKIGFKQDFMCLSDSFIFVYFFSHSNQVTVANVMKQLVCTGFSFH